MPDPIVTTGIALMTPVIKESVQWVWDQFGRDLVDRGVNEARWRWGVETYYTSLYERVGFVRVLGKLDSEPIEAIFTQINVLDRPTAELRYRLDEAQDLWRERRMRYGGRVKRMDALAALKKFPKLFILGKPGAGKTTFLKYAAVQAIQRQIELFPIFVTLKEMSDDNPDLRSGDDVLDFIVERAVFRIPKPRDFVTRLLTQGKALVLFDGLDEVNLADERRGRMINALNQFTQQFNESRYGLTCRVAATDYSFTQFEYVEMADFSDDQIGLFVDKWFDNDDKKRAACKAELTGDDANEMLGELAQVPLLLTLLCLVYEERNEFPPNRAEIYEEATRALLSKWDAARNIRRDTTHSAYRKLTLKEKQDLLAYLAAKTFEEGEYLVARRRLAGLIEAYLDGAPGIEDADGELIVREIAAQHGLLVERARDVWSFSHLTLQEYFAADYIVRNEARGAVAALCAHVGDDRWREVFLLTAGMLGDAVAFASRYNKHLEWLISVDGKFVSLLRSVSIKSGGVEADYREAALRGFYLLLHVDDKLYLDREVVFEEKRELEGGLDLDFVLMFALKSAWLCFRHHYVDESTDDESPDVEPAGILYKLLATLDQGLYNATLDSMWGHEGHVADIPPQRDLSLSLSRASVMASQFGLQSLCVSLQILADSIPNPSEDVDEWERWSCQLRSVMIAERNIGWKCTMTNPTKRYLEANLLLVQCLDVAYLPSERREAFKDGLLLPPGGS